MKISGFVLLLLLGTCTAAAQIERKPITGIKMDTTATIVSENVKDRQSIKKKMKDLDLTREQKIKLKEIIQANKSAKEAIENNKLLTEPEKKKQLRTLQKEQLQKIQAILTPEQREKFKASRQNHP